MRYATIGPLDLHVWLNHAPELYRHFFNTPRRRTSQQAAILTRALPAHLS